MSNAYETRIEARTTRGPCYWLVAAVSHLLAMTAAASLPGPAAPVAGLAVLASAACLAWRRPRWERLIWGGYGSIRLLDGSGTVRHCDTLRALFRSPALVVLELRAGDGFRQRVPLFACEQPEAVRRLGQRLLAGRTPTVAAPEDRDV